MKVGAVNALYHRGMTIEEIAQLLAAIGLWYVDYNIALHRLIPKLYDGDGKVFKDIDHKEVCSGTRFTAPLFKDATTYLQYFVGNYGIPFENIPVDMIQAVYHHISKGRIALPKDKDSKKPWFSNKRGKQKYQWKNGERDYSKVFLTLKDVLEWDYRYGICLIVPTDWRDDAYLDIDIRGNDHEDGIDPKLIPEMVNILSGYHYERSLSGGFHVFGRGYPKEPPLGVGLQLVSTLIVTYPTNGYTLGEVKK